MRIKNNYDAIAGAYDRLSHLVFFGAQVKAQVWQLGYIDTGSKVLIVGGGTGWILEEIAKVQPSGLNITYLELSPKMLEHAKRRNFGLNHVTFLQGDVADYRNAQNFDVIHTAFLFDNFNRGTAVWAFHALLYNLKVGGLWLYTDFKIDPGSGSGWKYAMLKTMYAFFRLAVHVEATELPQMEALFHRNECKIVDEDSHYQGFIESKVFQKFTKIPTLSKI